MSAHRRWQHAQATTLLQLLPTKIFSVILSNLQNRRDLARLAATCCLLWCDAPAAPERQIGPVEAELRQRAEERRLVISSCLPEGATSWVPYLLKCELRNALRRQAPLAAGSVHSIFVDSEGRLLSCGRNLQYSYSHQTERARVLGQGTGIDAIGPPTLVPSMLNRRIVSVASGSQHCLALSAVGEVYSWGAGANGALGHGDENDRAVPSRIESLERIESIAAAFVFVSAAIDDCGGLFTWGVARYHAYGRAESVITGLGYAVDPEASLQLAPKRIDALVGDRVVGVAFGGAFTLAVTDAGAVFSFGSCCIGSLGHGPLEIIEVLPRRIEALAQTERRFVGVAAGLRHSLALTEEGQLYGWGDGCGNGHAKGANPAAHTPTLVAALASESVKHVYAWCNSSCAMTETGVLYTWGGEQRVPRRVEGLCGSKVAAAAISDGHTLAADEHGVVRAFGYRAALGLGDLNAGAVGLTTTTPTPIPTLRVWALKSPQSCCGTTERC